MTGVDHPPDLACFKQVLASVDKGGHRGPTDGGERGALHLILARVFPRHQQVHVGGFHGPQSMQFRCQHRAKIAVPWRRALPRSRVFVEPPLTVSMEFETTRLEGVTAGPSARVRGRPRQLHRDVEHGGVRRGRGGVRAVQTKQRKRVPGRRVRGLHFQIPPVAKASLCAFPEDVSWTWRWI